MQGRQDWYKDRKPPYEGAVFRQSSQYALWAFVHFTSSACIRSAPSRLG